MIYFVTTDKNVIKIGFTLRPIERRLGALRKSVPNTITLLGVMPGGRKEEQDLHKRFDKHCIHGEWFHGDDEIHNFISNNCTTKEIAEELTTSNLTQEASAKLKEIGTFLRLARESRRLSGTELAHRAGIDRRVLTSLENGEGSVSLGTFFQILSILGLLRGLEEVVRPENDMEAIAVNVYKTRRKMNKGSIPDKKVDF